LSRPTGPESLLNTYKFDHFYKLGGEESTFPGTKIQNKHCGEKRNKLETSKRKKKETPVKPRTKGTEVDFYPKDHCTTRGKDDQREGVFFNKFIQTVGRHSRT